MVTVEFTDDLDYLDWVLNSSPEMRDRVLADAAFLVVSLGDMLSPGNKAVRVSVDGRSGGCFLCIQNEPRVYDIHTLLLRNCRGRRAVEAGRKGAWLLFEHGAEALTATCPEHLPEVRWFAQAVGFHFVSRGKACWSYQGRPAECVFMRMTKEDLCQQ